MNMLSPMDYRRDIDGLRAIAVIAVILFHYGFSFMPGGFIGVDIFFVISGYLITSIILNDLSGARFTFKDFYLRRARRILPALYAVLITSALLALVLFLPQNLVDFGKTLISTVMFGSNIFFMQGTGYFDSPVILKPLLHTWSLSVEEQFYLAFPIIIFCLRKYLPRYFFPIILLLFIGSLIFSESLRYTDQTKAFFLSPTRAWEFLLGALLLHPGMHALKNHMVKQAAGFAGLLLIGISAAIYTDLTPFPGISALLPSLGTALIILAGQGSENPIVNKILASRPFVFLGLRSYSLYLWHWPLLVFATYTKPTPLTHCETAFLILAALCLAIVTYKYVELPCRKKLIFANDRVFLGMILLLSLCMIAFSAIIITYKGIPNRFQGIEILEKNKQAATAYCADIVPKDFLSKKCMLGSNSQNDAFIIWGDSHASAVAPAIDFAAKKHGKAGYLSANSGCPPLVHAPGLTSTCQTMNRLILEQIKPGMIVFLTARWNYYIQRSLINHEGSPDLIQPGDIYRSVPKSFAILQDELLKTIDIIKSKGGYPVIVKSSVEFYKDVPEAIFLSGKDIFIERDAVEENGALINELTDYIESNGIPVLGAMDSLCDSKICYGSVGGEPVFIDNDHLNEKGALKLTHLFESVF